MKKGRGTARGRGGNRRDRDQQEPQRPGQRPEVGGAAAPAPAPQPAAPQQQAPIQGHPLGAWGRPPQQQDAPQGQLQGAWAHGQPQAAWGQGQPQSAQGQGPPEGQSRPALGQGPSQGQPRPDRGQGPSQGQPQATRGQGPPQGQSQPAWGQGPSQGQPHSAWGQGPPQGQPQSAWGQGPPQGQQRVTWGQGRPQDQPQPGQGPPQRQPQTAWGQPPQQAPPEPWAQPQQHDPPESHELQQEGASSLPGSGRATRRGTSRSHEDRAGDASVEEVATGVEGVAIEGGAVGGGDAPWQQRRNPYDDIVFNPEKKKMKGVSGTPVDLLGNYFQLTVPEPLVIYQYHVTFFPECESKKLKWRMLSDHIKDSVKIFDGTCIYLPEKLIDNEKEYHSLRVFDQIQIKITIRFVSEIRGLNPSGIQFLNIIWRRILNLMNLKQVKRHYFDLENKICLEKHGLSVLSGFQCSILRYQDHPFLDIDISHKMMRMTTVLDLMREVRTACERRNEDWKARLLKELVGQVVLAEYNNKTYVVYDIAWKARVTDTFERRTRDGVHQITYLKYYDEQHHQVIKEKNQPLLVTRGRMRADRHGTLQDANIFLVPELLKPTGLTDAHRSDFRLKKDLATHTKIPPAGRVKRLTDFMRNVKGNAKAAAELQNWGMHFEDNLTKIKARKLDQEAVSMFDPRNPKKEMQLPYSNADWGNAMRAVRMKLPVNLERWLVVYPQRSGDRVRKLVDSLKRVGPPLGMEIKNPEQYAVGSDKASEYVAEIKNHIRRGGPNQTQLVACILPNNRKDRYDAIKKYCCLTCPVASQMVLDKTLNAPDGRVMSVATKIAIQMNCKLGGVIWTLKVPMKDTMIIGIDTYHDSLRKDCSAVGVVATINSDFTRYKSTVGFQLRNQELGDKLQSCVVACLHAYQEEHKSHTIPNRVIVFRDGVGDGQLQLVMDHEVGQIKRAFGNANIHLAFLVVKKRINARFFLENKHHGQASGRADARGGGPRETGEYINPEPGTIIDDVVTKPIWNDFFLISQTVREGTVSPTHFNMLLNETEYTPDHFQQLSYKLTHMYYNWQGTIRVPAPCMYAHKLAFLVGQSLHEEPQGPLTKHLYFL